MRDHNLVAEISPGHAGSEVVPATTSLAALCVDAVGLAVLLDVSARTVRRLDDSGKLPEALMLGGCKRWVIEEIQSWLRAGAPPRRQWTAMRRSEK